MMDDYSFGEDSEDPIDQYIGEISRLHGELEEVRDMLKNVCEAAATVVGEHLRIYDSFDGHDSNWNESVRLLSEASAQAQSFLVEDPS